MMLASQNAPKTVPKSIQNRRPKKHAIFHRILLEKCKEVSELEEELGEQKLVDADLYFIGKLLEHVPVLFIVDPQSEVTIMCPSVTKILLDSSLEFLADLASLIELLDQRKESIEPINIIVVIIAENTIRSPDFLNHITE